MATGMDVNAFRGIFMAAMDRLETLERTPEGRAQLIREYREKARGLRANAVALATGPNEWGPEVLDAPYLAPPHELARRRREEAKNLDKEIRRLSNIKGIYNLWEEALKR